MQIQLITTSAALNKVFTQWCATADSIYIVTAWVDENCPALCALKAAITSGHARLRTLVVGLDFHQTSPSFLASFRSIVRIGTAPNPKGIFHPKVYLFQHKDDFCCLLGSSNFTGGGFNSNTEFNFCVTGKTSEPLYSDLLAAVHQQWDAARNIGRAELKSYTEEFKKTAASRKQIAHYRPDRMAVTRDRQQRQREEQAQALPEDLNLDWPQFAKRIKTAIAKWQYENLGYLPTTNRCQELFRRYRRLSNMPLDGRKFIGGLANEAKWFGGMNANGCFMHELITSPEHLDKALDKIPSTGPVSRAQYESFVKAYTRVCPGVGTASRLLAMKRPDLFLCLNNANRSGLAELFGLPRNRLRKFDGYWDLVCLIWQCPWWQVDRQPKNKGDKAIWNARVALLDSFYYEPREA
jgi:hypothetical protein